MPRDEISEIPRAGADPAVPSARSHDEAVVKAYQLDFKHQTAHMATLGGWRLQFLERNPRFMEAYITWDFWYANTAARLSRFAEKHRNVIWSLVGVLMFAVVVVAVGALFIYRPH